MCRKYKARRPYINGYCLTTKWGLDCLLLKILITDMRYLYVMLLLALIACQPAESEQKTPSHREERLFRTTDPSHLYFKNIRSVKYTVEEQPQSRIELYRWAQFSTTPKRPILYPVIANNWLQDEAYLFLETNDFEKGFAQPLTLQLATKGDTTVVQLAPPTPQAQHELATALRKHLLQGGNVMVQAADSSFYPVLKDNRDRQYFVTTVKDYLKLTEAL